MALSDSGSIQSHRRPRLWESALAWLILAVVVVNYGFVGFAVMGNWALVIDGIKTGAMSPFPFLLPLLAILGAVLLVRMNALCVPVFAAHFICSFLFIWLRFGLENVHWLVPAGYLAEIAVLYFCFTLLSKGVFKQGGMQDKFVRIFHALKAR